MECEPGVGAKADKCLLWGSGLFQVSFTGVLAERFGVTPQTSPRAEDRTVPAATVPRPPPAGWGAAGAVAVPGLGTALGADTAAGRATAPVPAAGAPPQFRQR